MKTKTLIFLVAFISSVALAYSQSNGEPNQSTNAFDLISSSKNNIRDKIVIISDLHLGNDITYSENVKHLNRLKEFLTEVRTSRTVKELVLGGDIFDEWYIPSRVNTYGGGSQADFIKRSVTTNSAVFEILNGIISDKLIKLTYIPGNHDMGFKAENINVALPGVNQARDGGDKGGIGTYHPVDYPQIIIEHGHRYDFFSNITPGANSTDATKTTLPPGYFFARIAANSFTNPTTPEKATKVRVVAKPQNADASQNSKAIYYGIWNKVLNSTVYVDDNFDEKIIVTGLDNFTNTYAINDIIPYNDKDGSIKMNLYDNLFTQKAWEDRLKYNNVPIMTNIDEAIVGSLKTEFIDKQSNVQYFSNSNSKVRIVVFGHTHKPMITKFTNTKGEPCIYANSGTWEDQKSRDKNNNIDQDGINMNFIVISPIKGQKNNLWVSLYQYNHGNHLLINSETIDL